MKRIIFIARKKLGVDHAIFATLISRGWWGVANILTIFALASFLSSEEQGYYYTFASLMNLQIFFELGFAFVLMQLTAHEFAKTKSEKTSVAEKREAEARVQSLVRLSRRWFQIVAACFWITVTAAGFVFFTYSAQPTDHISWRWPWALAISAFSLGMLLIPVGAVLEGCQKVKEVAYVKTFQDAAGFFAFWLALVLGLGLYSVCILHGLRALVGYLLLKRIGLWGAIKPFDDMRGVPSKVSWRREIFPFQWRISVSWFSWYLIFCFFSPVLFAYHGPTVAGQMGMTFAIFSGITNIALAWVSTKVPYFCELVALNRLHELSQMFWSTLKRSFLINFFLVCAGLAVTIIGPMYFQLMSDRVLPLLPTGLIALSCIANFFVLASASYLRAFKQEPFLPLSITMAIVISLSTYYLGRHFGPNGITSGYAGATFFIALPYTIRQIQRRLKTDHNRSREAPAWPHAGR
jgi:hypothetical protein